MQIRFPNPWHALQFTKVTLICIYMLVPSLSIEKRLGAQSQQESPTHYDQISVRGWGFPLQKLVDDSWAGWLTTFSMLPLTFPSSLSCGQHLLCCSYNYFNTCQFMLFLMESWIEMVLHDEELKVGDNKPFG
jgi:hypothetical protein